MDVTSTKGERGAALGTCQHEGHNRAGEPSLDEEALPSLYRSVLSPSLNPVQRVDSSRVSCEETITSTGPDPIRTDATHPDDDNIGTELSPKVITTPVMDRCQIEAPKSFPKRLRKRV